MVYFVPKDDKVVAEPAAKRAKKATGGEMREELTVGRDEVGISASCFVVFFGGGSF